MNDKNLHIRVAGVGDIAVIRELTAQIWPATYIPIIGAQQVDYMLGLFYTEEALRKQMTEYKHKFIICYAEEQPAAFASYSEIEPGVFKLQKIYILPSMQGRGMGRYMLNYITEDIKRKGAVALRLNVNIHNHPAMAFYNRVGFTHYRDEDIDIGAGYFMNDHVLSLAIE